ncbi:MAG: cytochrome c maturation protein CcmE [Rhodospirillales bacterium]|jgi:cytochrome c-type biogenesis protein CcmE|nr:cytochrome c maturation protein CcmE [Rhodospirillales bacterium]
MKRTHRRLTFVIIGAGLLAIAAALVLSALDDSIVFFQTPSELVATAPDADRRLRVGGLVEDGSVEKSIGGQVRFRITDTAATLPVTYTGILPDLFREGQGVVAEGRLRNGVFIADSVLAKHDENYMPPEAAEALKRAGQWQHMKEQMQETGQLGNPATPAGGAK